MAAPDDGAESRDVPATQFGLLGTRRLLPLFVAQFLGAFNDNVFKQALIILFPTVRCWAPQRISASS